MIAQWLARRESLFFIVIGLAEGMLTALVLAGGSIGGARGVVSIGMAIKVGVVAGLPEIIVFFSAEYAQQRRDLLRMEHQLNVVRHGALAGGMLGRSALRSAFSAAALAGFCAFIGACAPLAFAMMLPGRGMAAIVATLACLAAFGTCIGYATRSCTSCWSLLLVMAGVGLAGIGRYLNVI